jgi:hypothetical protein
MAVCTVRESRQLTGCIARLVLIIARRNIVAEVELTDMMCTYDGDCCRGEKRCLKCISSGVRDN